MLAVTKRPVPPSCWQTAATTRGTAVVGRTDARYRTVVWIVVVAEALAGHTEA